jgi:hypothetical protein
MDVINNPSVWVTLLFVISLQCIFQDNTIDYYICYIAFAFLILADLIINLPIYLRNRNRPLSFMEIEIVVLS